MSWFPYNAFEHPKRILLDSISSRYLAILLAALLVLNLHTQALAAYLVANVGNLFLLRSLTIGQIAVSPGSHSYHAFSRDDAGRIAVQYLQRAMQIADVPSVRWALGRTAIWTGQDALALAMLQPLSEQYGGKPLFDRDLLLAFSWNNLPQDVVEYSSAFPSSLCSPLTTDTVALAYLQLARSDMGLDLKASATNLVYRAHRFRPSDLFATYYLWKWALAAGDIRAAAQYRDTLIHFPPESVVPLDDRLIDLAAEVVPDLVIKGIWDQDQAQRVMSLWVVHYHWKKSVERLVQELAAQFPEQPRWLLYAAELNQRQGDWEEAQAGYRHLVAVAPDYYVAYLRLGLMCEEQMPDCSLSERCAWFERYHDAVPQDVLGLLKMVQCTGELSGQSGKLSNELNIATDPKQIVAALTGLSPSSFHLGPNQVRNGGFEERFGQRPLWWVARYTLKNPNFNPAAFVVSIDSELFYEGSNSALVVGLWHGHQDLRRTASMNGYQVWDEHTGSVGQIGLSPGHAYLLSLAYKTETIPERDMRVFFVPLNPQIPEVQLPTTHGEWRFHATILCNSSERPLVVAPIPRSAALGRLWFDNVEIREIIVDSTLQWQCH